MEKVICYTTILFITSLGMSSTTHAGCVKNQITGIWETFFSDGNSCKLKINGRGEVIASASLCYDPDRGVTQPDSGSLVIEENCAALGILVIEGVTVELGAQFAVDRSTAGGVYVIPDFGAKGSFSMVRLP